MLDNDDGRMVYTKGKYDELLMKKQAKYYFMFNTFIGNIKKAILIKRINCSTDQGMVGRALFCYNNINMTHNMRREEYEKIRAERG
ncbi:hypothetical protein BHL37_00705 [Bacillus cereus]|nr:hypothetical protein BHL37_00705 [Bacillus cereus]